MMSSPQQELFDAFVDQLKSKYKGHVYDTILPPKDTPYPIIYVGRSSTVRTNVKSGGIGLTRQIVSVWHNNPRRRGTVSEICEEVEKIAMSLQSTKHYSWSVRDSSVDISPDESVKPPLIRGVVNIQLQYS